MKLCVLHCFEVSVDAVTEFGVRYITRELQKSKRDEMRACTRFSEAELERYLRIKPKFRNWYLTDLQTLEA